jgi:hypothetical protein
MELHTLGVDGGYTQDDVIAVARAFTGWTIYDQQKLAEFQFNPAVHDRKEKRVLGHTLPPMRGEQDGIDVIEILAHHPSTASFISRRSWPSGSSRTTRPGAHRSDGGDIHEDGRRPAWCCRRCSSRRSSVRGRISGEGEVAARMVLSAVDRSTLKSDPFVLARRVADLGQPLYGKLEPTGYPTR